MIQVGSDPTMGSDPHFDNGADLWVLGGRKLSNCSKYIFLFQDPRIIEMKKFEVNLLGSE